VKFLEACHALMRLRLAVAQARTGYKNTWHQGPSQAWPLVVIIMGECRQFLDGQAVKGRKPDEDQVRKCQFYVSPLVRKSRSVMMVTIRATQKPTIDSIPSGIRDNAGISLAFGVKTIESATAVPGADIRDYASFSPVGLRNQPCCDDPLTPASPLATRRESWRSVPDARSRSENRRPRAMFLSLLLGGLTVALTIGLLDVLVLHADAINSQKTVSAGVDLALGLLLLAIGGLVATGLWVPKTCVTWADAQGMPSAQRSVPGGRRAVCAWAGVR
jgi:hypothetical protein